MSSARKAGHTPGPWTCENMEEGHLAILAGSGAETTLVAIVDHNDDEGREIANARLIAAAPRLLEALIRLYALTAEIGGVPDEKYLIVTEAAAAMEEALR